MSQVVIDKLVQEGFVTSKTAGKDLLKVVFQALADEVAASEVGAEVKLGALGKFKVVQTKERQGRNPSSGETMTIPAKVKPKFVVGKALK